MGRRQCDVFIAAAVADDEVGVQQLVVVGQVEAECVRDDGVAGQVVGIRQNRHRRGRRVTVVVDRCARDSVVGDIVEEGPASAQAGQCRDRILQIAFDRP
ncbi:hypothetical protein D9M72_638790 [compost metagenome]